MTTEARQQGCNDAFTMKRGSKYYVCYGQYPSTADAKTALPEILKNFNDKAWILTK
jgi:septal ring-binding cell division protein DamX